MALVTSTMIGIGSEHNEPSKDIVFGLIIDVKIFGIIKSLYLIDGIPASSDTVVDMLVLFLLSKHPVCFTINSRFIFALLLI